MSKTRVFLKVYKQLFYEMHSYKSRLGGLAILSASKSFHKVECVDEE